MKTKEENPKGLHMRYLIKKIIGWTEAGRKTAIPITKDTDPNAEYFVLRLDEHDKDPNHIRACRIGAKAYADAIQPFIPELAKDLYERYNLEEYRNQSHPALTEIIEKWELRFNLLEGNQGSKTVHSRPLIHEFLNDLRNFLSQEGKEEQPIKESWQTEVSELILNDRKFEAIKVVFANNKEWGVKKAKEYVDSIIEENQPKEVEILKSENEKLRFMIENGLGWKDVENDITYPHEL